MKRLVSVVLLVVLMSAIPYVGLCEDKPGMFEEFSDSIVDVSKTVLEQLVKAYKTVPDKFDGDYIEMTYRFYNLYMAARAINTKAGLWDLKLTSHFPTGDMGGLMMEIESSSMAFDRFIMDEWERYANGEKSKEEIAKTLMVLVDNLVLSDNLK